MAAILVQFLEETQTLTTEGFLSAPTANPFAVAFSDDLHLFAELSGTEDVFELWEAKTLFCGVHFRRRRQRLLSARADFKLMRTAAFQTKHSGTL